MPININIPPKAIQPRNARTLIHNYVRSTPEPSVPLSPFKTVPEEEVIKETFSFLDFPTGVADLEEDLSFLPMELVSFGSFCTIGLEEDS